MNIFTFDVLSFLANVILTMLLVFQWDRSHAKEQSVKNNIFAMRRMMAGLFGHNDGVVAQKAKDITENVDATLATLDARSPFIKRLKHVLSLVHRKNDADAEKEISIAENENI